MIHFRKVAHAYNSPKTRTQDTLNGMADSNTSLVQKMLPLAIAGDNAALDALLLGYRDRLTFLTRRMLGDFRRVRRWAETDDVLQSALVRLISAMQSVKPQTSRDFFALAALQIRRELIDLARHYYGAQGMGANHESRDGEVAPPDGREEANSMEQWTELHEQIGRLPEEERNIVDLLYYQGLSQTEAAEVLEISLRTVQRRWHDALIKLHRVWKA